jgi:hypothetical protein
MGVNFSAINLKVGEIGLADLEKRLDAVDKKSERIRDNLVANFKGVRRPAAEAGEAIEEIGEHTEIMSHSAMIGLGELTRGIAKTAEAGHAGAFSMKEFAGAAMRLGATLGSAGGLAGIAVLVGGALYEMFSKAREEMKKTEDQFKESIANMANETRGQDLVKQARDLLYGTPYDEKNQLRNPSAVPGAFQGSLVDLRSRIAKLQDETRGMVRKGAFQGGKDNEALDALDDLLKKADPLEKKLRQINTALDVMRDMPAEKGLIGPTSTAQKPLTPEEIKKNAEHLEKLADYVDGVLTHLTLQSMGAKLTGGLGAYVAATIGGAEGVLGGKGPTAAKIKLTPDQQEAERIVGEWKRFGDRLGDELSKSLASSFSKGFEALFSRGGNLKSGFKAMTGAVLEGLGTLFEQVGESALVGLSFMQRIKDAIMGFTPELGIAAAVGLIALGAALHGAGSRMASSGSGGGGSYSSSAYAPIIHQSYATPAAPGSSPPASSITPRQAVHNYVTIIGPNDPQAQRTFDELQRRSRERGSLG